MDSDSYDGELSEIAEENEESLLLEDIALQLKYGNGDDLRNAIAGLQTLIAEKKVDGEWLADEGLISILFSRLNSNEFVDRPTIIRLLRSIPSQSVETKERMGDVNCLTALVKSLARDNEERREAVGLLLDLADLSAVRRRIGRIRGCILMLVTILNGDDDPVASYDAERLLNALSKNAQNAIHMAEAGYFNPLVQHLKEGSEMSKILMASTLSRMALTDHTRASLGEDGAIEPLVTMLKTGNLESKSAAISALQNLSILKDNISHMFAAGVLSPLLQLLFSVTSSLMSLREPASVLLARISLSESILIGRHMCGQMLSLLNLSSPSIQLHILQALNNIASHPTAYKARIEIRKNGAIQLLLPFLSEPSDIKLRTGALNLLSTISKDSSGNLDGLLDEDKLLKVVNIVSTSVTNDEKAAAVDLLSNMPMSNPKTLDVLKRANLLPILVSLLNTSSMCSTDAISWLAESVASILIRFTVSNDEKLQSYALEVGIVPLLVKLLSSGTIIAKCRAATSLAQLSQNSCSLGKSRVSKWTCLLPSKDGFCEVHGHSCSVRGGFCLIRAGAVHPLMEVLKGKERVADEAVLSALATLLQDTIWEKGSKYIAKTFGIGPVIKVLESGTVKAKQKALQILESIFRIDAHRLQYGECAQLVLIDLAHKGDPSLKPTIAKLLAQLELLQVQSSYFSGEAYMR